MGARCTLIDRLQVFIIKWKLFITITLGYTYTCNADVLYMYFSMYWLYLWDKYLLKVS